MQRLSETGDRPVLKTPEQSLPSSTEVPTPAEKYYQRSIRWAKKGYQFRLTLLNRINRWLISRRKI
jgi:hypothetical protein